MNFSEILTKLKEPFPADAHVERDLKGGGKWFFVPWQRVRERLDDVYPEWQVTYGDPVYLDKYCVIQCTITIAGISRSAPGNAEIELVSSTGKDMSRGTPMERAVADAFKNAAEAFGVAAYLDEQSLDKRQFTIRYLHSKGDGRALKTARENGWMGGSLPTEAEKRARTEAERHQSSAGSRIITEPQVKRFQTIARNEGGYTTEGAKRLLADYRLTSSKSITTDIYDELCTKAADKENAAKYNRQVTGAPVTA